MEIRPLGDTALVVQLGQSSRVSDTSLDRTLHVRSVLEHARIRSVTEITSAFATVTLFYDPAGVPPIAPTIFDSLEELVRSALAEVASSAPVVRSEGDVTEIPVCYASEFALDLAEVAARANLTSSEVIELYCNADYHVATVGFTPGFPYLSGLPPQLATARRATPRAVVPAGSVAIGGNQAGIYPISSPGGWHVIGRTPVKLFDVTSDPPALLCAGDRVRFRRITAAEFHAAAANQPQQPAQATGNK